MLLNERLFITDLSDPAWHTEKVLRQLRQGFFAASLITKRPAGILPILAGLPKEDLIRVSVQVTITGLGGTVWEPGVQPAREVFSDIPKLFDYIPPEQVTLRYDPIIPGVNDSKLWFERYVQRATELGIKGITISILDVYPHVRKRIIQTEIRVKLPPFDIHYPFETRQDILSRWLTVANGIVETRVCCEPGLEGYQRGGCDWIIEACERITGCPFSPEDLPKGTQRKSCGCPKFMQLLSYADRCPHGCLYCYRKN